MALLRQAIADIERGVKNCETAQQKRAFLAGVRDGSELDEQAYLAFCADRTGEIVGEDDLKLADWQYIGPYLNPWDDVTQQRVLSRDSNGDPIPIRPEQHALFGTPWCRAWQDGPSKRVEAEEEEVDPLRRLGPMDEVVSVEASPPAGGSWGEVAEMQRVRKREYERRLRGEWEVVQAVKGWMRRLRNRLGYSMTKGRRAETGEEKMAASLERKRDSNMKSR